MHTRDDQDAPTSDFSPSLWHNFGRDTALMAFLMIGFVLAGSQGLLPKIEALLTDPVFGSVVLVALGLGLFVVIVAGTFLTSVPWSSAHATGAQTLPLGAVWSSVWLPIKVALAAGLLVPMHDGVSMLAMMCVDAARFGAGV